MPFNSTGQSGSFHYLVEFILDSTTLNYADEDISIQTHKATGVFYEGRLPQSGVLSRNLGTFLEPKESVDNFDVNLDNRDGVIQDLINVSTFANREVRIWLGEGNVKADYSRVFTGVVVHPNGIRWDEDSASFTVIDKRVKQRRIIPPVGDKFFPSDNPNMEEKSKFLSKPIIYGNWSSGAVDGLTVPAICIDMSTTKKFQISGHKVQSIDRYLKNAEVIDFGANIQNVDLAAGTFELINIGYDATVDIVSVNCKGLQTINSTLIEEPGGTLRHLASTYMGLTVTDFDVTALRSLDTDTGTEAIRRYINAELSSETYINELMNESGTDYRYVDGKIAPKFRKIESTSGRSDFNETDIILEDEQSEKAAFSAEFDPERFFANRIRGRGQYDPVNLGFRTEYTSTVTSSVAEVTAIVERPFDFQWYYQTSDIENRVNRELTIFSDEPIVIRATLSRRAMLKDLADQIDITYNIFNEQTVQIRRLDTDLGQMTTRVLGYDIFEPTFGNWTEAGAPNYNDSSVSQRKQQGFWTDDNGFASPSDAGSKVSKWF